MQTSRRLLSAPLSGGRPFLARLSAAAGVALAWAAASGSAHAQEGNWLHLRFDPDQVERRVDGVLTGTPQTLGGGSNPQQCALRTDGSLLAFSAQTATGSNGIVGFKSDANIIGQRGGSGGRPCGRVLDKESLIVSLGSLLSSQKMVEANLQIVIRNATRIRVVTLDGSEVVGQFEVRSGSYTSLTPTEGFTPINCATVNCQVSLAGGGWRSIRMTTDNLPNQPGAAGEWSIGEGTSTFRLQDFVPEGELDCAESDTEDGASIRRLDDAIPANGCVAVPYRLDFDGQTIEFIADYSVLAEGVEPAFAFEVTWDPEWVVATQDLLYDPGNNPPQPPATFLQAVPLSVQQFGDDDPFLLDFCPVEPDEASLFVGQEGALTDMSGSIDGLQYGCLSGRNANLVDFASCQDPQPAGAICVQVEESGYIRGDWTATRTLQ